MKFRIFNYITSYEFVQNKQTVLYMAQTSTFSNLDTAINDIHLNLYNLYNKHI